MFCLSFLNHYSEEGVLPIIVLGDGVNGYCIGGFLVLNGYFILVALVREAYFVGIAVYNCSMACCPLFTENEIIINRFCGKAHILRVTPEANGDWGYSRHHLLRGIFCHRCGVLLFFESDAIFFGRIPERYD